MIKAIKQASKNKIVWYVGTRYVTYGVQFVVSLLCAAKMGPYYFGLWGFMILLLNYMQQINLGISNSANIMLVQERNNPTLFAQIESTAFFTQGLLCVGVLFFALGNILFDYSFLEKYKIGGLFYVVCLTALFAYMVQICMTIYRIKHQLAEIAFSQSIIPFLTFVFLFVATGKQLLFWFSIAYLVGNMFSFIVFLTRGNISFRERPKLSVFSKLLSKGFFLFVYNCCFYLIMISTRTIVSAFYQVEEFGYFTFAYTLADAVILLLGAITFLLFPKSIEKLHTNDKIQVKRIISLLRNILMTLTHGLMYVAFVFFPIITWLIPKYSHSLPAIYTISLALLAYTVCTGYTDYLMAQNKDRQIAFISGLSLLFNVLIAVFLAKVVHCSYVYVIVATIISYWLFSILCVMYGKNLMNERNSFINILSESFPLRLMIPFFSTFLIILFDSLWILPIPFLLYVIFNYVQIKNICAMFRKLIYNPNMLDVIRA